MSVFVQVPVTLAVLLERWDVGMAIVEGWFFASVHYC